MDSLTQIEHLPAGDEHNPFTLLIRKPTPGAFVADAAFASQFDETQDRSEIVARSFFRLSFIHGWLDVCNDAGEPMEFSHEAFAAAFTADAKFAGDVLHAIDQRFSGGC